jgi:hypothetical protein
MKRLCDGHVASLVSNAANGFPDVLWMCYAVSCACAMAFWSC